MKKRIIITIVILISILIIGYLFWRSQTPSRPDMSQIINQGILPSLGESTNPLKNKPDVNPIDVSNPFRSIKTNPFE